MIQNLEVFRLPESMKMVALSNLGNGDKEITPAMSRLLGDEEKGT
jgi:hypothetical protein